MLREGFKILRDGVLDVLYPPRCLVCGAHRTEGGLCAVCVQGFRPVLPPFCDRCGEPIPAGEMVCRRCAFGPEPPYAWSQAMAQYVGSLRRAVQLLKYDGKTALARPLGVLLARSLDAPTPLYTGSDQAFDCVVPVPLHPARLRQRGFNQAERIARVFAQERGWRLDAAGLRRVRATPSQTALRLEQRTQNIHGAFSAQSPLHFANQSVLILDDVMTTMSTVNECARVLRNAGAKRVAVLALARGL